MKWVEKTLKNLSVSLRLPHLIRPPSASESVEYTALYKFFFWFDLIWKAKEDPPSTEFACKYQPLLYIMIDATLSIAVGHVVSN